MSRPRTAPARSTAAYVLQFDEDFTGLELDPARWVARYLAHWATPERSAARYGAEWSPERIRFFVDDRLVRTARSASTTHSS